AAPCGAPENLSGQAPELTPFGSDPSPEGVQRDSTSARRAPRRARRLEAGARKASSSLGRCPPLPHRTVHPPALVPEGFHLVSLSLTRLQDQPKPRSDAPRPLRWSRVSREECLRLRPDPLRSGCPARRPRC